MISFGGIRDSSALAGNWRIEHNLRSRLPIVILALHPPEKTREIGFKPSNPFIFAIIPSLIEAVTDQDDISFYFGEIVMNIAKIFGPRVQANGIG